VHSTVHTTRVYDILQCIRTYTTFHRIVTDIPSQQWKNGVRHGCIVFRMFRHQNGSIDRGQQGRASLRSQTLRHAATWVSKPTRTQQDPPGQSIRTAPTFNPISAPQRVSPVCIVDSSGPWEIYSVNVDNVTPVRSNKRIILSYVEYMLKMLESCATLQ
jgi:hypothetical protein